MKQQKLFAAILCAASPFVHAASDEGPLDIVVVTGTRLAQPLKQSLNSTTVITRQDIEAAQAPDVPGILRDVAGLELSQNGGTGKSSGLYLRGANSTQVLVLLDGVRINSATTGTTALDQLMLDQVERIEVVRGNVSSLYGSDAIGGVVQIFTRKGRGETASNVSVGLGSLGTRRFSAGLGGAENGTDFSMQFSAFGTDGVSALNPSLVPAANPDRNGYRNNSLSASVGHALSAGHRLSATFFGSDGKNWYDNAFNLNRTDVNSNQERLWKFSLASDDQFSEAWHSKVMLANGVDQYRDFLNNLPVQTGSLFQTFNTQLDWQNEVKLGEGKQLMLGAASLRQQVSTDINPGYTQTSRQINSIFAGYTGRYNAHQLQVNLRQDGNSQYGSANTWLLGYGYAFNDAWRVAASYGTAFRAPTFNELYYPGFGDATLRPERSHNSEAGVHYASGQQQLDAVYFDNRTRDLIVYATLPAPKFFGPVNLNQAQVNGVEVSYSGRFGDTAVHAALTSQNPRDAVTGVQLDRRAKLHGNAGVTQQMGGWQVGGEWLYSDKRTDAGQTLAGYNVFNISARHEVWKGMTLSLRADNLTNQNDSNAYGYNPPGRTFYIGMSYRQ